MFLLASQDLLKRLTTLRTHLINNKEEKEKGGGAAGVFDEFGKFKPKIICSYTQFRYLEGPLLGKEYS